MPTFISKVFILGGGGGYNAPPVNYFASAGAGSVPVYEAVHSITLGQSYAVVVGIGGAAGSHAAGGNSSFDGVISYGGGVGSNSPGNVGGANTAYNGGTGDTQGGIFVSGGGGAGAGGSGGGTHGTDGGIGVSNSISGSSIAYGGGGCGHGENSGNGTAVAGGAGLVAATANRGGGGAATDVASFDGGDGVVIIRYDSSIGLGTGGTITTVSSDTVHTFTSSGTFVAPGNLYIFDALLLSGD